MADSGSQERREHVRDVLVARASGGAADASEISHLAARADVRAVVLVEGVSDVAALEAVAHRLDVDLPAIGALIVPMGGATSIGRFLELLDPQRGPVLSGLCDLGEADFTARRLFAAGRAASGDALSLAPAGFQVCDADLEDELIRALGVPEVERVFDAEGDLAAFRTFQRQPFQRERPVERQLRRFLGAMGGRKERYARALAERLDRSAIPRPLEAVLVAVATQGDTGAA